MALKLILTVEFVLIGIDPGVPGTSSTSVLSLPLGSRLGSSSNSKYHTIATPCGDTVPRNVAVSALVDVPVLTGVGGSVVTDGDSAAIAAVITVVFSQSVVAWLQLAYHVPKDPPSDCFNASSSDAPISSSSAIRSDIGLLGFSSRSALM